MYYILLSLLFLLQGSYILANVPTQIVCPVKNTTCLNAEARDMFSTIVGGNAALGTEILDTMFIDYIHIDEGDYKLDLRSIRVSGLKNLVVDQVSVDLPSRIFRVQFYTDLVSRSQYLANGTLLLMPIEGKGNFLMKYNNICIEVTMPFNIIKDAHGNDVMVLKTFDYVYDVRDSAQYYFDNLYFGNDAASSAMHKAVHRNWKLLTVEFGRYLLDSVVSKLYNSILIYVRSRPLREYIIY